MCVVENRPKYVTALGETDEPGGWRQNKGDGGIVIDDRRAENHRPGTVDAPFAASRYRDRLWVLHSGTREASARLTRRRGIMRPSPSCRDSRAGLTFAGPLAFIGLSQVRESAIFSGIAIAERPPAERTCGVWVVNIEAGEIVAWVKFEDAVPGDFCGRSPDERQISRRRHRQSRTAEWHVRPA